MNARGTRWLLLVVLVGQLLLLSAQVPAGGGERTRLEAVSVRLVAPVSRLVATVSGFFTGLSEGIAVRGRLLEENARLSAEVEELRHQTLEQAGALEDLERLSETLGYVRPPGERIHVADVVYIDHTSWLRTVLLYVGSAPVETDQAVISPDGLVGRVVLVTPPYAKVQLITDRSASVGAMIERTRRQGLVRGTQGGELVLDFVPLQSDVRVGDRVRTAGIDGIYARGVPLGTVVSVEPGNELFHRIQLRPAVDFGRLDQVFIREREAVPEATREADLDAEP